MEALREHTVPAERTGRIVRNGWLTVAIFVGLASIAVLFDVFAVAILADPRQPWWARTPCLFVIAPLYLVFALRTARHPHWFPSLTREGAPAVMGTVGNEHAHLVLRGGTKGPNFSPSDIASAREKLAANDLPTRKNNLHKW